MQFITSAAVIRHIASAAGCVRNLLRLKEVKVDQCYSCDFTLGGVEVYRVNLDDEWVVAYCDDSGIITVTHADSTRGVFYIHYLPDRHMVSGWMYRNQTPR